MFSAGHNLVKLVVRNAWLSVDGLCLMPTLTYLTLERPGRQKVKRQKLDTIMVCLDGRNENKRNTTHYFA